MAIGNSAFSGCTMLEDVTIPTGVETIEGNAFFDCVDLQAVAIPTSVKTIGNAAFSGCKELADVELPLNLETLGSNSFRNCTALESIYISKKVGDVAYGESGNIYVTLNPADAVVGKRLMAVSNDSSVATVVSEVRLVWAARPSSL